MPEFEQESDPVSDPSTGPIAERWKSWLWMMFTVGVTTLIIGDVFLYSLHKSLQARVENQERRIERLNEVLNGMILSNKNAEKIEKIEQQLEGINGNVKDLSDALKAQNSGEILAEETPLVEMSTQEM